MGTIINRVDNNSKQKVKLLKKAELYGQQQEQQFNNEPYTLKKVELVEFRALEVEEMLHQIKQLLKETSSNRH